MREHGSAAVALEGTAESWTEGDGASEGDEAADGVHDGGAGEVMEAGTQSDGKEEALGAHGGEEATRPDPRPSGR